MTHHTYTGETMNEAKERAAEGIALAEHAGLIVARILFTPSRHPFQVHVTYRDAALAQIRGSEA